MWLSIFVAVSFLDPRPGGSVLFSLVSFFPLVNVIIGLGYISRPSVNVSNRFYQVFINQNKTKIKFKLKIINMFYKNR